MSDLRIAGETIPFSGPFMHLCSICDQPYGGIRFFLSTEEKSIDACSPECAREALERLVGGGGL